MTRTSILAFALLLTATLQAETPPAGNTLRLEDGVASPPAKISDLAWLAGYWQGSGFGGACEEVWGKPNIDRMFGYFSFANDKGHVFSEAMMMVEEGGSVVLKLKHFRPDFVGWEEKDKFVTFRLVKLGEREAFFSGLTFRRTADDRLLIYLKLTDDGKTREEAFTFSRVSF
jgi:hypothetical protein